MTKSKIARIAVLAGALTLVGCESDARSTAATDLERKSADTATATLIEPARPSTTTTAHLGPTTTQPDPDPGTTATNPEPGAWGQWSLDPAVPASDSDTSVHVLVGPYECAGNMPPTPLHPGVRVSDGEIRITINVAPTPEGVERTCLDLTSPVVVDLGMPIDGRPLIDASCLLTTTRAGPTAPGICVERP